MKLSKETVEILTNFATIGKGIVIRPGNFLSTIANHKAAVATAIVKDTFPSKVAIFNLQRFLDSLSIFDEPDLEFNDKFILISGGGAEIRYLTSPEALVVAPPEKLKQQPDAHITFSLTDHTRNALISALGALKVKDIAVRGRNGKISLCAFEKKDGIDKGDLFAITVGSTDEDFQFNFSSEVFKIMPGEYQAEVFLDDNGSLRLHRMTPGSVKKAEDGSGDEVKVAPVRDGLYYMFAGTTKNA